VNRAQEIIASMLLTWHNLHYYQELMQGLRDAIAGGGLSAFVADFHAMRAEGDIEPL
jgi:queuine tRNA-ribosyltransferase